MASKNGGAPRSAAAWTEADAFASTFAPLQGLQLSLNLSAAQPADPASVGQVRSVLQRTGLKPSQLELELTESRLMGNPSLARHQVAALKALGVQVAIDDFGTGYPSLADLKRFAIDKLKVDQSFVRGMLDDAAIVQAVIGLGHTLGLQVVAAGVETLPSRRPVLRWALLWLCAPFFCFPPCLLTLRSSCPLASRPCATFAWVATATWTKPRTCCGWCKAASTTSFRVRAALAKACCWTPLPARLKASASSLRP